MTMPRSVGTIVGSISSMDLTVTTDISSLSLESGDILIYHQSCEGQINLTPPASEGWVLIHHDDEPWFTHEFWWKRWGDGNTDNTNLLWTSDGGAGDYGLNTVSQWRGLQSTGDPFTGTGTHTTGLYGASGSSIDAPDMTLTAAPTVLLRFYTNYRAASTSTPTILITDHDTAPDRAYYAFDGTSSHRFRQACWAYEVNLTTGAPGALTADTTLRDLGAATTIAVNLVAAPRIPSKNNVLDEAGTLYSVGASTPYITAIADYPVGTSIAEPGSPTTAFRAHWIETDNAGRYFKLDKYTGGDAFGYSDNPLTSWTTVSTGIDNTAIMARSPTTLLVAGMNTDTTTLEIARSTNNGISFGAPETVATGVSGSPVFLTYDDSNLVWVLLYTNATGHVECYRSIDDGVSFTSGGLLDTSGDKPFILWDGAAPVYTPAAYLGEGIIAAFEPGFNLDSLYAKGFGSTFYPTWLFYSRDGGLTWVQRFFHPDPHFSLEFHTFRKCLYITDHASDRVLRTTTPVGV